MQRRRLLPDNAASLRQSHAETAPKGTLGFRHQLLGAKPHDDPLTALKLLVELTPYFRGDHHPHFSATRQTLT